MRFRLYVGFMQLSSKRRSWLMNSSCLQSRSNNANSITARVELFAGLFGIPKECLPQDWAGFADYFSEAVQSEILNVSDRSRTMARRLLTGADSWVPVPASYQDLTVALLPSPVRRQFGFSFNDEQKRQIDHAVCRDAAIVPAPARAVTIRWAFSALSRVCAIVCGSAGRLAEGLNFSKNQHEFRM